jgi:equilibrative nucleoside transporter 1/2/3
LPVPESSKLVNGEGEAQPEEPKVIERVTVLGIAGRISVWVAAVFFNFLVCLSVFPAITAIVVSTHGMSEWGEVFFIPVSCFLLYNIGDFTGKWLAGAIGWPNHNTK